MTRVYEPTYWRFPREDLVLIRGWRTTSTSPSSSSEEVSSEAESSEVSSSQEKSEGSEKSSSLYRNEIFPYSVIYKKSLPVPDSPDWSPQRCWSCWTTTRDFLLILHHVIKPLTQPHLTVQTSHHSQGKGGNFLSWGAVGGCGTKYPAGTLQRSTPALKHGVKGLGTIILS